MSSIKSISVWMHIALPHKGTGAKGRSKADSLTNSRMRLISNGDDTSESASTAEEENRPAMCEIEKPKVSIFLCSIWIHERVISPNGHLWAGTSEAHCFCD